MWSNATANANITDSFPYHFRFNLRNWKKNQKTIKDKFQNRILEFIHLYNKILYYELTQ